jgi:hypothetical protein
VTEYKRQIKLLVVTHFGENGQAKSVGWDGKRLSFNATDLRVPTRDYKNSDGGKHRKGIGRKLGNYYDWLGANNFPGDFRNANGVLELPKDKATGPP